MRLRVILLRVSLPLLLLPAAAQAQGTPRLPDGQVISGTLSFDGHATAGDFTGNTSDVTGHFSGAADLTGARGWVEALVKTLKTGNGKRDKDLNKSMESDKYPTIRFDLERVNRLGGSADSAVVNLHGELKIHGVTRQVDLPATVRLSRTDARVHSDFPLSLKDYRIGGLKKLFGMLKMYDGIEVHVDLVFRLAGAG